MIRPRAAMLLSISSLACLAYLLHLQSGITAFADSNKRPWQATFPAPIKQRLMADTFAEYATVATVPPDLLASSGFVARKGAKIEMADPGQPWSEDCIKRENRPFSRLCFAAVGPHLAILCHEQGGFMYFVRLVIVDRDNPKRPVVWDNRIETNLPPRNLSELRAAIAEVPDTQGSAGAH